MRRAILSSVLIIGAALAVVFAGGSFSAFTDEENIEGTATAAIVDFELQSVTTNANTTGTDEDGAAGGGSSLETLVLDFDSVECNDTNTADTDELDGQDFFAPGDTCVIEVNLTRAAATIAQQLAVILSVDSFSVTGATDLNGDAAIIGIDCDTGEDNENSGADWTISYAFVDADDAGTDDDAYMPAATADPGQRINITVALDPDAAGNAGSGCQGDALSTINLTILATQDTTNPHNTADDVSP